MVKAISIAASSVVMAGMVGCGETLFLPAPCGETAGLKEGVGDHSHQRMAALEQTIKGHDWRMVTFTKGGCLFSTPGRGEEPTSPSCARWNIRLMHRLLELKPDLEAAMDLGAGLIHPVLDEHLPQAVSL